MTTANTPQPAKQPPSKPAPSPVSPAPARVSSSSKVLAILFTFSFLVNIVLAGLLISQFQKKEPTPETKELTAEEDKLESLETKEETIQEDQVIVEEKIEKQISIKNGNIIETINNQEKILVNKKEYNQIKEFTQVVVSPDQEKMCFLGQAVVPIWLFWSATDGTNVNQIAVAKNCVWNNQSNQFAFNNHTTDVSPIDVYNYNIEAKKKTNLTETVSLKTLPGSTPASPKEVYRFYELPSWSADDKTITSKYSLLYMDGTSRKGTGISEINLETGEIKDR